MHPETNNPPPTTQGTIDLLADVEPIKKTGLGVFGNKGGTGKLLCFNAIYSALLAAHKREFTFINADTAAGDIARLYGRSKIIFKPDADYIDVDLSDPDDIAQQGDAIIGASHELLLINTPPALSIKRSREMLDELGKLVDIQLHAFWPVTRDFDSLTGIFGSIQNGMLGRAKTLTLVINDIAGHPAQVERTQASVDQVINEIKPHFDVIKTIKLPRLSESITEAIRVNDATLFEIAKSNPSKAPKYRQAAAVIETFHERLIDLGIIGDYL